MTGKAGGRSTAREAIPDWLGSLSAAEQQVWGRFPLGDTVDFSRGDREADDPARGHAWGDDRTIRASVIAALALGARRSVPGRTAGVRIIGARIVGQADLRHGTVDVPLTLRHCRIEDTLRLDEAVTKSIDLTGSHTGRILAEGAHIRGSLKLTDATVTGDDEFTLNLNEVTIDTDLAAARLRCNGPLYAIGAQIGAVFNLNRARLEHPGRIALNIGGAATGRALLLAEAEIRGQVRMVGAGTSGLVRFSGARITDSPGIALVADTFSAGDDGHFDEGFEPYGGVSMANARFGGLLTFSGARLTAAPGQPAARLTGIQVARALYFSNGFRATGELRVVGARIGGYLDLIGMSPDCGELSLYQTSVATVRDHGPGSWPRRLNLDGFTYNAMDPYLPATERMRLLRRQVGGYRAQPYEFMAAYYRALGHEEDTRAILLDKERVRRRTGPWWSRAVGTVFGAVVGYGYRPIRAVFFSALIQLAAIGFFAEVRPTQIRPDEHVVYYPALYAADLFVPIVHFGQADAFQSHGFAAVVAMVLPYLGWAFGIAIVAGASRMLTKGQGVLG